MTERTVTAYFSSYVEAESTATKLRSIDATHVNIDQTYKDSNHDMDNTGITFFGNAGFADSMSTGSGLSTFGTGFVGAYPLGLFTMGDSGQMGSNDPEFILEATIDEDSYHKALEMIDDGGGRV